MTLHRFKYFSRNARRGQSGSALVAVLCLIFSGSLLLSMVLALSKTTAFTVLPHTEMQRSHYLNEGVANRMQYLVAADRALHDGESFDTVDFSEFEYERFLPDGSTHILNYHGTKVPVSIHDMRGGLNFARTAWSNTLSFLKLGNSTDTEFSDKIDELSAQITDYTDTDDSVSDNGVEADDFDISGKAPLPRNAMPEIREEFLYLPMFREIFPPDSDGVLSAIRLIPPETDAVTTNANQANSRTGGTGGSGRAATSNSNANYPSIFNAPDVWLTSACGLEDTEVEQVKAAVKAFREEKTKLSDGMENDLLEKLRRARLNWQPGDYYTLVIRPDGNEKRPGRRLRCSFQNSGVGGPSDYFVRYLEWLVF